MISPKDQSHHSLTLRSDFITLLDSAIYIGSFRFARQITLTWLAYYPGDLPVRLKYGRLLLNSGFSPATMQLPASLAGWREP